jgi:hypothetical protein
MKLWRRQRQADMRGFAIGRRELTSKKLTPPDVRHNYAELPVPAAEATLPDVCELQRLWKDWQGNKCAEEEVNCLSFGVIPE